MPIIVTDENFEKEIQKTDKMLMVDFYATWCDPCSMLAPVLEKIEKEFEEKIVLLKANVDDNQLNAQKFQVDRIPMVMLFKNGKPADSFTGLRPEADIKEWLKKISNKKYVIPATACAKAIAVAQSRNLHKR